MKTTQKVNFARIVKRAGLVATLLNVVLALANAGRAQSAAPASKPAVVADASVPARASAADTSTKPATVETAQSTTKSSREGIQVHGYWTIEVRDPSGKVTAHREFENAIQPQGKIYLLSLLAGNSSPGALMIALNGGGFSATTSQNGNLTTYLFSPLGNSSAACETWGSADNTSDLFIQGNGSCLITTAPNSSNAGLVATACQGTCSGNLSVSAPTISLNGGGSAQITLSGSIAVCATGDGLCNGNASGSITDVETIFESCNSGTTPTACANVANAGCPQCTLETLGILTQKTLDGANGDPAAVPYGPSQTIFVTVQLTFQ